MDLEVVSSISPPSRLCLALLLTCFPQRGRLPTAWDDPELLWWSAEAAASAARPEQALWSPLIPGFAAECQRQARPPCVPRACVLCACAMFARVLRGCTPRRYVHAASSGAMCARAVCTRARCMRAVSLFPGGVQASADMPRAGMLRALACMRHASGLVLAGRVRAMGIVLRAVCTHAPSARCTPVQQLGAAGTYA